MTREEAKHIVDVAFSVPQAVRRDGEDRTYHEDEIREAKNMAIQALSQEPCDDAISRQAVNEIINDIRDCISVEGYWAILEKLKKLPSVTPKPETVTEFADRCRECGAKYGKLLKQGCGMTREVRDFAKSRIEYLLKISSFVFDERDKEALEAAIKALSQEPCIYDLKNRYCPRLDEHGMLKELEQQPTDVISLEAVIEWLKTKDIIKLFSQEETARRELKALSQEPTDDKCHYCEHTYTPYKGNTGEFEQEPCDDEDDGWIDDEYGRSIRLEQNKTETIPPLEPCDDAIDRAEAQTEIMMSKSITAFDRDLWIRTKDAVHILRELPSVTQKSGKWLLKRTFPTKLYDEYLNEYQCSECYRGIRCTESQLVNYPYCHCGAKMESEDKE